MTDIINRASPAHLALETTLLVHGLPKNDSALFAAELWEITYEQESAPAVIGIHYGRPIVGLTGGELSDLLEAEAVPKANTANLGILMHRGSHAATTVSATMELAAAAGLGVFSTGGIGGVHRGYAQLPDISSDLMALTRFPVAVVTSGVKSLLDVVATREVLETLGVPVVGYRTDHFPAFYRRESSASVDARFDDVSTLASFIGRELARTGRGIVVANPIPRADELDEAELDGWLKRAFSEATTAGISGRDVTPFVLGRLHELSGGATLRANLALVRSNVRLGATLARVLAGSPAIEPSPD